MPSCLSGTSLQSIDMETAGEMQALPLATLRTRFGDKTGTWYVANGAVVLTSVIRNV